jgi:hypothetical protein
MATLGQKILAENKMRELLEQSDLPQPDYVEYGYGCIRLLWHEQKAAVIVDIDEAGGTGEAAAEADANEGAGC